MLSNKLKLALIGGSSAITTLATAVAVNAAAPSVDDVVSSSTDAIVDAGTTTFGVFFGIIPTILLYVIPIVLVLWGIRWMISHFHGKRK